jgi:putative ABC transport system permease protein
MISVARRNLWREKTRFIASVSGVAFSILLVIFLMGVYNAFSVLSGAYISNMNVDVIVAQEGVSDMFHTFSSLSNRRMEEVERLSGGKAYGLTTRATNVMVTEEDGTKIVDYPGRKKDSNVRGEQETVSIMGFDTKTGAGGPWLMLEGSNTPGKREIVVDRVFSQKTGLKVGDQLEAYGKVFTIVGIADKNNMLVYTRAFISLEEMEDVLQSKDIVNFILVSLPNPEDAKEVADKLERELSGISAFNREEFAVSNGKMITESFLPIIMVITILGFMTGAVVIGLTVYTSTMEKIREFGVLKAIGASNTRLFLIVFEQSLWGSLLGYVVGVGFSAVVSALTMRFVPAIVTEYTWEIYLIAFGMALLMSLVASFVPVKKISNLDPAMVFRK